MIIRGCRKPASCWSHSQRRTSSASFVARCHTGCGRRRGGFTDSGGATNLRANLRCCQGTSLASYPLLSPPPTQDPDPEDDFGWTALHTALSFEYNEMTAFLVKAGCPPSVLDRRGVAPLCFMLGNFPNAN